MAFEDSGRYPQWPKVADAGIEAQILASIMVSATPFVSLWEAKALKHLRKGAFEDSDIMRSAHKWPAR